MQSIEVKAEEFVPLQVGEHVVPVVLLDEHAEPPYTLKFEGVEFTYARSVPIKGHGASLPPLLAEVVAEGRDILAGERGERYYLYYTAAPVAAKAAKE